MSAATGNTARFTSESWSPTVVQILRMCAIFGAYFALGRLGIALNVAEGVVTPVWAPTGIALFGVIAWGRSALLPIALAAFVTNISSGASVVEAPLIALGNTLEAYVAFELLRRFNFARSLPRPRDVIHLALVAGLAPIAAASIGTSVLRMTGDLVSADWLHGWVLWWLGDAMGAAVVTPTLLAWYCWHRVVASKGQALQGLGLLSLLAVVASFVFLGDAWHFPALLYPLLMWMTLRFGHIGATTPVLLGAVIAIGGALNGTVIMPTATTTSSVQALQALIALVMLTNLVVASAIAERHKIDRMKDDFVTTASHELRTPLTSIVGFSNTLVERWDTLPEDQRLQLIAIVNEQSDRLSTLVNDVLFQSQLDNGSTASKIDALNLRDLIEGARTSVGDSTIEISCPNDVVVYSNPDHLHRVFCNLLGNASKYGEAPRSVQVARTSPSDVEVRVVDSGPGVSHEFEEELFERFTRAPEHATMPGTGLGLSIARGLLEAHGGSLTYERHDGTTHFVVKLATH
jgi:signal transduction histidine kinase